MVLSLILCITAYVNADSAPRTLLFRTIVAVNVDGSIQVTETIVQNSGVESHGIDRDIPFITNDKNYGRRLWPISDLTVATDADTPNFTTVSIEGDFLRIRIGEADTTITGKHTYQISYRVQAAVTRVNGDLRLSWDAFDTWRNPVDRAEIIVVAKSPSSSSACYYDPKYNLSRILSVDLQCSSPTVEGTQVKAVARDFDPGASFTMAVSWPVGSFTGAKVLKEVGASQPDAKVTLLPDIMAVEVSPKSSFPYINMLFVAVAGLFYVAGGLRQRRRLRPQGSFSSAALDATFSENISALPESRMLEGSLDDEAPIEFLPPWDLSPAEMAVLSDVESRADLLVLTVVDLAARGEVDLRQTSETPVVWEIRRHTTTRPVSVSEQTALTALLQGASFADTSEFYKRGNLRNHEKELQGVIEAQLVARGLLHASKRSRTASIGFNTVAILLLLTILPVWAVALIGLTVHYQRFFAPPPGRRKSNRTEVGNAVAWRCTGFGKFLEGSENNHAVFAADAGLFRRYMGFAVMFGAVDKWTNAFTDVPQAQTDHWVKSGFVQQIPSLGRSLSGGVSPNGISSSSSSSSSGGRARGGGGGGGGGSW